VSEWKWLYGYDKNAKCVAACGDTLLAYRNQIVEYRGRIWHLHCLLDHLVEKDPPEAPAGQPFAPSWWGGGGATP
jgi:hypothetical protein